MEKMYGIPSFHPAADGQFRGRVILFRQDFTLPGIAENFRKVFSDLIGGLHLQHPPLPLTVQGFDNKGETSDVPVHCLKNPPSGK